MSNLIYIYGIYDSFVKITAVFIDCHVIILNTLSTCWIRFPFTSLHQQGVLIFVYTKIGILIWIFRAVHWHRQKADIQWILFLVDCAQDHERDLQCCVSANRSMSSVWLCWKARSVWGLLARDSLKQRNVSSMSSGTETTHMARFLSVWRKNKHVSHNVKQVELCKRLTVFCI